MRAVIQRVLDAQVTVEGRVVSRIGPGLLTLLGFAKGDDEKRLREMLKKIAELRIFEDESGKMNRSLLDVGGEHLLVSQFTLLADTSSGRRPSFVHAMPPTEARALYDRALIISQELGLKTQGGVFQADMRVQLTNSGPVTLVLESHP